jgi:hypothetical protein
MSSEEGFSDITVSNYSEQAIPVVQHQDDLSSCATQTLDGITRVGPEFEHCFAPVRHRLILRRWIGASRWISRHGVSSHHIASYDGTRSDHRARPYLDSRQHRHSCTNECLDIYLHTSAEDTSWTDEATRSQDTVMLDDYGRIDDCVCTNLNSRLNNHASHDLSRCIDDAVTRDYC